VETHEPEFFDDRYSPRIYVDQAGQPYNFPRKRAREAQIIKLLGGSL
jgi:hypothetical protein